MHRTARKFTKKTDLSAICRRYVPGLKPIRGAYSGGLGAYRAFGVFSRRFLSQPWMSERSSLQIGAKTNNKAR